MSPAKKEMTKVGGGWLIPLWERVSGSEFEAKCYYSSSYSDIKNTNKQIVEFKEVKDSRYAINNSIREFERIFTLEKPDLLHIHGTEMAHSYSAALAAQRLDIPYVVSIQGLVSEISRHMLTGIEYRVLRYKPLVDLFVESSLAARQLLVKRRGEREIKLAQSATALVGRTAWDRAWCKFYAPEAEYLQMEEPLRGNFIASRKWTAEEANKYSLFMAQSATPVKGLHLMLEALAMLREKYSGIALTVAGKDYTGSSVRQKLRRTPYQKSILKQIKRYQLGQVVRFTGVLSDGQMMKEYLNTHVYVQPSLIENSPNSLMEAMYLGVPCVASYVGGIPSLLNSNDNVILYQADSSLMLADAIDNAFERGNSTVAATADSFKKIGTDTGISIDILDLYRRILEN